MNILILNWKDIKNPEVGGAEVIAFELARRLVKDGHTVTFFTRSFKNALSKEIIDGVTILRRGNKLSVYFEAFLYYKSLNNKPDRVIDMVNTICWQTPLYVPREKRVTYVNQLAKEVLFYQFPWPLSWISYFLERFEYLPYHATKFICYSKSTKEDLVDFGIPRENISLFPLGIDHQRYQLNRQKASYPLFIFVARLVKMKRPSLCVEAFKQVVKAYPKAKLFIIGNGSEENILQKQIVKDNVGSNVFIVNKNNFFIDKTIKDVKVKYMQEGWVLLLPSVKEGWGMVVTEAAACGTPAIVSDVTGLRDSVIKNKTGIVLSPSPSADELAKAMIKLIKDKKLRYSLAKEAVKNAKDYTWERSYITFKKIIMNQ